MGKDKIEMDIIKNIKHKNVEDLSNLVTYLPGQIVSKTLVQNKNHSFTLFAFGKGEEISTHESDGDALVIILDGKAKITIDNEEFILNKDESIVMPKKTPHAVYGEENLKMMLLVFFN